MTVLVSQIMSAIHGVFAGSGMMAGATVGLALSVCGQLAKKEALTSMAGAAGTRRFDWGHFGFHRRW